MLFAVVTAAWTLLSSPVSGQSVQGLRYGGFAVPAQGRLVCHQTTVPPQRAYRATVVDLANGDRCEYLLADPWELLPILQQVSRSASDHTVEASDLALRVTRLELPPIVSIIRNEAHRYGLPPEFLAAVMMAESRADPFAVGDLGHAVGLFQLHDKGLGSNLFDRRYDPTLSANVAAESLAEGWREGKSRSLQNDELVRFAYAYSFNPGGSHTSQGDLVIAFYRRFAGVAPLPDGPAIDPDEVLHDAGVLATSEGTYFVALFSPVGRSFPGPESLAEMTLANYEQRRGLGAGTVSNDGEASTSGDFPIAVPPFSESGYVIVLSGLIAAALLLYHVGRRQMRPATVTAGVGVDEPAGEPWRTNAMPLFKPGKSNEPEPMRVTTLTETAERQALQERLATIAARQTPGPAPVDEAPVAAPTPESERLARISGHLDEQQAMLSRIQREFREESVDLSTYVLQQRANMERILSQLETRLLPLREYVEAEESNLRRLIADMKARPEDFVAENFAGYIAAQETNIGMTRRSIEHQRNPFIEYFEAQTEALEVALKRFDHHVERLAKNLAQQHEILDGLLTALRDDDFQAVRAFLAERQKIWQEIAARGTSDPAAAYQQLSEVREQFARKAAGNAHLEEVLAHAARADDRLGQQVKPMARHDAPRTTRPDEPAQDAEEWDEASEAAEPAETNGALP